MSAVSRALQERTTEEMTAKTLTHALQYQQRDGTWRDGFLGYTLREARGVAREGRNRTGRAVRIIDIGSGKVVK